MQRGVGKEEKIKQEIESLRKFIGEWKDRRLDRLRILEEGEQIRNRLKYLSMRIMESWGGVPKGLIDKLMVEIDSSYEKLRNLHEEVGERFEELMAESKREVNTWTPNPKVDVAMRSYEAVNRKFSTFTEEFYAKLGDLCDELFDVVSEPSHLVCPSCGTIMPEDANFCGSCGSKLR